MLSRTPPIVNTAPTSEPLTTAELKAHCRVTTSDEDTLIDAYAKACRMTLERMTGIVFIDTTFDEYLDAFPCDDVIRLYRGPLISVSSLKIINTSGTETTLVENTDFVIDTKSRQPRICPAYGTVWSPTRNQMNAVHVTYKAGYSSAANVPEDLKQLLKLFFTIAYENRSPLMGASQDEVPVPASFRQMIANHAIWSF